MLVSGFWYFTLSAAKDPQSSPPPMFSPRSRRGLSPFKRRVAAAMIAAFPAVAAAHLALRLVPRPDNGAALGDLLFGVAVQAVVLALLFPLAERLLPETPPPDDAD